MQNDTTALLYPFANSFRFLSAGPAILALLAVGIVPVQAQDGSGSQSAFEKHDFAQVEGVNYADAGDLNGDDLMDVAVMTGDSLFYYPGLEQDGEYLVNFTSPVGISSGGVSNDEIDVVDLDGDEDDDILLASSGGDGDLVAWYENTDGNGSFAEHILLSRADVPDHRGTYSVHAADIEGDGDLDVFSVAAFSGDVEWFENMMDEDGVDDDGFGDRNLIATGLDRPVYIRTGDFDDDGDPDPVVAIEADKEADDGDADEVTIYENMVGETDADEDGFGDGQVLTSGSAAPYYVRAADLTGDDLDDVAFSDRDVGDNSADRAGWIENTTDVSSSAPSISFGDENLLVEPGTGGQPRPILPTDLDGDGMNDLVASIDGSDSTFYYLNTGNGTFGEAQTIDNDGDASNMVARDMNGDGAIDMLTSGLTWYENMLEQGGGDGEVATVTFEGQESAGTTVTVASVTVPEGGFVAIHDASLLEDPPVVQGSVIGVSSSLEAGTHEDVQITLFDVPGLDVPADTMLGEDQTLIAMPHRDSNSNNTYDFLTSSGSEDGPYLDGDDNAVVAPAEITIAVGGGGEVAFETGAVAAPSNPNSVDGGDLSGDGVADMIVALPGSGEDDPGAFNYYPGISQEDTLIFDSRNPVTITSGAVKPQEVDVLDFDGDGDMDVLGAASGRGGPGDRASVYINDGSGGFTETIAVSRTEDVDVANGIKSVEAADFDGDGDMDIIAGGDFTSSIALAINNGDGTFADAVVLTTAAAGVGSLDTGDLDGDGDPDILAASEGAGDAGFAYLENMMGEDGADEDGFGDLTAITSGTQPYYIRAGDINGDEMDDVLLVDRDTDAGTDRVVWLASQGDEISFGEENVILGSTGNQPRPAILADLDSDGDNDVAGGFTGSGVFYFLNEDGEGGFGEQQTMDADDGTVDLASFDLDGDGDQDVMNADRVNNQVLWYENQRDPVADPIDEPAEVAQGYALSAAYPNPFNPRTNLELEVAQAQRVQVAVYDVLGREVTRLFDGRVVPGQVRQLTFEATSLPSGLYLIQVQGETFNATRKAMLVK